MNRPQRNTGSRSAAKSSLMPLLLSACLAASMAAPAAIAQVPSTDIFLLEVDAKSDRDWQFGSPRNITDRVGYDNQPAFLRDGSALLYTSGRGEQTDIYRFELASGQSVQVTDTAESEYSPTPIADGQSADEGAFSVIRVEADGTQRLWRFASDGSQPSLLLPDIAPVGYHAWVDDQQLILFVLGEPPTLERASVGPGAGVVLARDIGRAFGRIPNDGRMSFIHKRSAHDWWVVAIRPDTGERTALVKLRPGREDVAWAGDGSLLMGDGSRLFRWHPSTPELGWVEVADFADQGIDGITRLAWSADGRHLALVAARP